jgi:uncharacterized protein involved in type VI secretion and phage assembly
MSVQELVGQLAHDAQQRYYGKYRAFVTDVQDPNASGRVRLRIPSVLGDAETDWAEPVLPFGGTQDTGLLAVPEPNALVWAEFAEGDLSHPVWTGAVFVPASGGSGKLGDPAIRAIHTPAGQLLALDDSSNASQLRIEHPSGATVTIDNQGTIELTAADGTKLTLDAQSSALQVQDANGNSLSADASGVTIQDASGNSVQPASSGITLQGSTVTINASQVALGGAGGEPVILGQTFLTGYLAHTHLATGPAAPTGPPIPTTEPASLSPQITAA